MMVDSPFSGNVRSLSSPPVAAVMTFCVLDLGPFFDGGRSLVEAIGSIPPQADVNPFFSGPMRPSCLRLASCASATLCSLAKPCCLSWNRWNIWAQSRTGGNGD